MLILRKYPSIAATVSLAIAANPASLSAQDKPADGTPAEKPASENPAKPSDALSKIKKINDSQYQLDKVIIDKMKRTISFEAEAEIVNAKDLTEVNSVEYVVVTPQGKTHETLFVTEARPLHLNIAFKLLGYKENKSLFRVFKGNFPTKEYQKTSDADKAKSYFTTTISWKDSKTGKTQSQDLNDLLITAYTKKSFREEGVKWSYGGSFLHQGKFAAEINNDLISILTDRGAVANYVGKNGEDGDIWLPVTEKLPAKGTKVTITISPSFPQD